MSSLSFFIAWRYIRGNKQEKNINIMIKLCFIGIVIGTFALALVLAVMDGFEKETHQQLQGVHSDLILQAEGQQPLDIEKIAPVLSSEFPAIAAFSPTALNYVMVHNEQEDMLQLIGLKGIDPAAEAQTTLLNNKIVPAHADKKTLSALVHDNTVLIGEKLAQLLHIGPGDMLDILYAPHEQLQRNKITLERTKIIIGGIFKTGIEEFDSNMMICTLTFLQTVFPDSPITTISIKLAPHANEQKVIQQLHKRFDLETYSWKDLYPALVTALTLEKYASFLVLSLIMFVASMSILSLLFMYITKKRGDIAILHAMGCSQKKIISIFFFIGFTLAVTAIITGLLLAFIVGMMLKRYVIITLPDAYYVSHLPISLEPHLFGIVFLVVLVLSILATWLPLSKIKTINVAEVLRFET